MISSFRETLIKAELDAIGSMEHLGLKVSIDKTEAMAFMWEVLSAKLHIGEMEIKVGTSMKYLGLVNSKWTFREYFQRLFSKALNIALDRSI